MPTQQTAPGAGATEEQWSELLDRFHEDESLRARVAGGETPEVLSEFGISIPERMEARIVENTDDVTHVVFPPDPNRALSDERLSGVAGGDCAGTLGTVGSWGSVPSCVSSAGSVGSISSASI